jgi:hypothetical protein
VAQEGLLQVEVINEVAEKWGRRRRFGMQRW